MNLILIVFFTVCANLVYSHSSCITSHGSNGECISVQNCPSILNLLHKKNKTPQETEMLKKSRCDFQGNTPLVCCPTQSKPTDPPKCETPDGQQGKCISLRSCPHLSNLLKPPVPPQNINFVKSFICSGPEKYSVCCAVSTSSWEMKVTKPSSHKPVNPINCSTQMTALPPDPKTECCGFDSAAPSKITGGNITSIDTHPWVVMLEYVAGNRPTMVMCGGVLISGQYVLTAAHCIAGHIIKIANPSAVRLGEFDITHEGPDCVLVEAGGQDCTDGVTRIPIKKTIPHPKYNPIDPLKRHDIGLIRLKEIAPFTDFIRPVCLPKIDLTLQQNLPTSFVMSAVGWGAVGEMSTFSPVKLQVELPFVDRNICQEAYRNDGRDIDLWEGQLCAGGKAGKDTCKGDSGGPLLFENDDRYYEVIGITSFGPNPCGLVGVSGIYTNVYQYLEWIQKTISAT